MAPRQRAPAGVALALLTAAAAAGLGRVFGGAAWWVPVLVAAAVPHALLAAARRRHRPAALATGAAAALGVLFGMLAVAPSTTWYGVPTRATGAAFLRGLGDAPDVLRTAKVPVEPRGAALLLAVVAVWAVAMLADRLAHHLDATLGAMVPALVLFVAVAALGSGPWLLTTALFAGAAVAFLLLQHGALLASGRAPFRGPGVEPNRAVRTGVLAATGAVAAGLLVGPALPGARSEGLFDYRALGDGGGEGAWQTVTPLVDIRKRLVDNPDTVLFTVETDRPQGAYWRLVGLDRFDGRVWGLEGEAPRAGGELPGGAGGPTVSLRQTFTIGPLASRWLPAAFRPVSVDLDGARVIPDSVSLVADDEISEGTTYTVVSELPAATPDLLGRATPVARRDFEELLELPDDFPFRVRLLAREVVRGATSPYEQALALQNWFRDPEQFTYSLDVPAGHADSDIVDFLFESRRGYCEQFAGSYAAMARAVGLPTRVAVGFLPGRYDPAAGQWQVTGREAHAWPEVYLDGFGWLPFDPTPIGSEPSPGNHTGTGDAEIPVAPAVTTTVPVATSTPAGPLPSVDLDRLGESGGVDVGGGGDAGPSVAARILVAIGVLAAVAAAGAVACAAAVAIGKAVRRARRRRARDPRARVAGAWEEATDRLAEAGIRRRPSATPVEFALRHAPAAGAGDAGPPLMVLAHLHTAALFAAESPAEADATEAWERLRGIEAALRAAAPFSERMRRRVDPRTLRQPG